IGNGFAIVRPPGHHSYGKLPQGFCIFNNVSIAAKFAVEHLNVRKGDKRFLFVNFHAYHHGAFWPYDEEYDYDNKYTNVVSIPLNAAMNSEGDYFAALKHLVIPIANEFAPELILVSLGFDSAYYDDLLEHGQGIKAHGYGHMMRLLHENWPNKVLAVLEGGYFSLSYTECAVMTAKGLKVRNGLPRYKSPAAKLFVGAGFRYVWNRVQELKVARTRDWVPGMSDADKQFATEKILEYTEEYDYNNKTVELSEKEFLEQLLWNSEIAGQAFLLSIPITLWFYEGMKNCVESESNKYLIIDMYAYNSANALRSKEDSTQECSSSKPADV
uniref:Histone deacetylase domain-containing protein n=1 Tax=Parascaris equorum TaxID=6256 RepID=A0A914RND6_PAREQ